MNAVLDTARSCLASKCVFEVAPAADREMGGRMPIRQQRERVDQMPMPLHRIEIPD